MSSPTVKFGFPRIVIKTKTLNAWSTFRDIVNANGGIVLTGVNVIKNLLNVLTTAALLVEPSNSTVACTLAIRDAVIVGVSVVKIVVIPAIVIAVVKTLSGVIILAVITEIAVVINRSCGPNCAVIIRWEYSRKTGENKSGENATLDSRFCGMPKL